MIFKGKMMKKLIMALFSLLPLGALAETVEIEEAYAFAPNPVAKNGAVFMQINNLGETPRRLISVQSDIAKKVEIHTHEMDGDVMRMIHLEEGLEIAPQACTLLERGGYHVMLMGLQSALEDGDPVDLVLEFENGETMPIEVEVDLEHETHHHHSDCARAKSAMMDH